MASGVNSKIKKGAPTLARALRRFRGSGNTPAEAKRNAAPRHRQPAPCEDAKHHALSERVATRTAPVDPTALVDPPDDGVGMNDCGRGMASPLRDPVGCRGEAMPRPHPLLRLQLRFREFEGEERVLRFSKEHCAASAEAGTPRTEPCGRRRSASAGGSILDEIGGSVFDTTRQ